MTVLSIGVIQPLARRKRAGEEWKQDASGIHLMSEVPGGAVAHTDFSASGLPNQMHCSTQDHLTK